MIQLERRTNLGKSCRKPQVKTMHHRACPLIRIDEISCAQEALYLERRIVRMLDDRWISEIGDHRSRDRLSLREIDDMHLAEIIGIGEEQYLERRIFCIFCDAERDVRPAVSLYIYR